jgi:DNA-directed RNA polymerase subunit H (RpoH/RPB5)
VQLNIAMEPLKSAFQQIECNPVENTVYKYVLKFCEYNNIKLIDGHDYSYEKVTKTVDIQSFLLIKGILQESEIDIEKTGIPYYIFIFGQRSTTTSKTAFGNKADDIANVMGIIKEQRASIMFVSEHPFKTNVVRAITSQTKKKNADFQIRSVVHDIFKFDRIDPNENGTGANIVHEVLGSEDAALVKAEFEKNLTTIPYIPAMDPVIIWLMGNPKQIVKITHPSIPGCSTVYYRVIR